jgi:hypothetical protein
MKEEFLDLYNKWHSSFIFSAHGSADPAAKEPYNKLREWCINNRDNALVYIREILLEGPNDIVKLLDDLYKEEYKVDVDGFWQFGEYCNFWLNITDPDFEHKVMIDYYKDWNAYQNYLKENYISWNPLKQGDPNITFEEFKQGKRNKK